MKNGDVPADVLSMEALENLVTARIRLILSLAALFITWIDPRRTGSAFLAHLRDIGWLCLLQRGNFDSRASRRAGQRLDSRLGALG